MFTQFNNVTENFEITEEQDGTLFYIEEGEGVITGTLPAITRNGVIFGFASRDTSGANKIKASGSIAFGGALESGFTSDAFGDVLTLMSVGDCWMIQSKVGEWTV